MATAAHVIGYASAAAFGLLALGALKQWRTRRDRPSFWAALSFGTLGLVVLAARVLPDEGTGRLLVVLNRLLIVLLVLFPYLLFRFTAALDPPSRRLARLAAVSTAALALWTIVLPDLPESGEPRPLWFNVYVIGLLAVWASLSAVVGWRLWRAGRGQPTVARRRMELLSAAAAAITLALAIAAESPAAGSVTDLTTSSLALVSAIAFLLGLAPPETIRLLWRRREQEQLRVAIADLMKATTEDDVVARVLPPMAGLVGAQGVALLDGQGTVVGTHGVSETMLEALEAGEDDDDQRVLRLDIPGGALAVWTSPYAPFFGDEELSLLHTLGALTGLALDRTRLFTEERTARVALERANELKANFIALAAHELRTPVTSVHGIVMTLARHDHAIDADDRAKLDEALRTQTDRMRQLVEQLLDLTRLDAEAVFIDPEPVRVRRHVAEIVAAAAGERAPDISVEIADELEAVVDADAFDRILSNLVVNALRHGAPPITVSATQSDHHFRLTVEDRGTGVPPQFVQDLFERFSRSDEARARGLGSGLGLAIARSYARAHGGDLLYERARPYGARFELVLPAPPNASLDPDTKAPAPLARSRG